MQSPLKSRTTSLVLMRWLSWWGKDKVDLSKGFHQVEVEECDRDKTCFTCPFGKFRYKRMPFGLANAPSCFND